MEDYSLDEGIDGEKSDGEDSVSLCVDAIDSIDCVDDEDGPEGEGEVEHPIGEDEDGIGQDEFVVGDSTDS